MQDKAETVNRKMPLVLRDLPSWLIGIVRTLQSQGFEAYIAGGAVRDLLQGVRPADYDVVTNARPAEIAAVFQGRKVERVGKTYPVCLIDGTEVATYRTGRAYTGLTTLRKIEFADTLHEDLKHRDFTINSMALCPFTGRVIDDFGGMADLKCRIIRFTDSPVKRIKEDPCRIIRAARFVARLKGKLDENSRSALCYLGFRLIGSIAPERIRLEILKAMKLPRPSLFFETLHEIGILKWIFPSLAHCVGLAGGPHHDETVFEHNLLVGDALSPKNPLLRLAGYLHDVGKAEVVEYKAGQPVFIGHEKAITSLLTELRHLKFSNDEIDVIRSVIDVHMRPLNAESSPRAVRRLLATLEALGIDYHDFLRMRIADRKGNRAKSPFSISEIKVRLQKFRTELAPEPSGVFSIRHLALSGNDVMRILNLPSGPAVGRILQDLLEQVLDQPERNTYENLKALLLQRREEKR
jgi:tRNA nucleotidyltransferase/poly(A) polymerase